MAKKNKSQSQICIVTITGKDKVGIIAKVSNAMATVNVNIIDVNQKIMEDYFVMTMACDIAKASVGLEQIQHKLARIAKQMELIITIQHEDIFKMMHRV